MTNERIIALNGVSKVTIEDAQGDLRVQGWGRPEGRLTGDEDIQVRQEDDQLFLQFYGDGEFYLPVELALFINEVQGDLVLNNSHASCKIGTVNGDAVLENLDTVQAKNIRGDLRVRQLSGPLQLEIVDGDLTVDSVRDGIRVNAVGGDARLHLVGTVQLGSIGGDAILREARGAVQIENVGGDLRTSQLHGDCRISVGGDLKAGSIRGNLDCSVGGEAVVRVMPEAGQAYRIRAGGDITCRLNANANLAISATSGGEIHTKGIPVQAQSEARTLQTVLGDGSAALELNAGGDINLVNRGEPEVEWEFDFDAERFGELGNILGEFGNRAAVQAERIANQVEAEMTQLTDRLDAKFAEFGDSDEFATKIQAKIQSAMQRAEEKINEAMRRAEERAHEAEKRHHERQAWREQQRHGRGAPFMRHGGPMTPPAPPAPPTPEVSSEERMMILKMLSEGQITVEQADELLAALGGKVKV